MLPLQWMFGAEVAHLALGRPSPVILSLAGAPQTLVIVSWRSLGKAPGRPHDAGSVPLNLVLDRPLQGRPIAQ